ncbi:acetyl esterase [Plantibacter sp. VKM Ac-1784]|uniref:Acetyl esterase n=1 Tax=Plantibacter elymi (nom. nud.) TaxID=199708 RepID=A0ABY1RCW0_9MICO|nr:alpha/beta hydrolase [Plantibacter sp. VKM Ac-1784]SMQ61750.1 acetyl esterase [Plantibacter sp. VKM Ac-1784]
MTSVGELQLDPGILAWAARIEQHAEQLPALRSSDLALRRQAARRLSDLLAEEFTEPAPPSVEITTSWIDGPAGPLELRRYRPAGLPSPAPTQLALHGGGFTSGTVHELLNDRLLAARALAAGIQVVALGYRLAPEHPYPAAVDDTIHALRALTTEAGPSRFDVDPGRLGIAGNSAGGGIAASAVLHLRDASDLQLVHQALEVPAVSLTPSGDSATRYARGFGLDDAEALVPLYLGGPRAADAYASPLEADDLSGLPPTQIQVAEHDPLRDAGLAYGRRLVKAGVSTMTWIGRGHVHASGGLTAVMAGAREWQAVQATALREAYGTNLLAPEPTQPRRR